ncbi:ABC transporter ATP-binding protein [Gorillibacterium timonense]|uniref:ABC transporter ATP-binding protein n=1 Tax=Gorillibacterium timonense TaxID=1689269 RepID=UPI0009E6DDB3|nr:ABC transporter ATP-binding protein [Gorillibacterium timonense]
MERNEIPNPGEAGRDKTRVRRFIRFLLDSDPPKGWLTAAVLLSLINTLVGLTIPLFTKNLVNGFSLSSLGRGQIVGIVLAFLAQAVSGAVSVYLLHYSGNRIVSSIRERLWAKLLRLPVGYYDSKQTGDTVSRLTNDTAIIKGLITEQITGFFTGILSIVGSLAILFYMNWQMTLLMLVVFPLAAVILVPLGYKMYGISKSTQEETAGLTSVVNRVVTEIRLVKASGAEQAEYGEGTDRIKRLFRLGLKEARISAVISPLISFLMVVLLVALIGFGGVQVSSGRMTAGSLVAFIMYLFQIILPITQISQFFTQFQKAVGATDSINAIMEEVEEAADGIALTEEKSLPEQPERAVQSKRELPVTAPSMESSHHQEQEFANGQASTLSLEHITFEYKPEEPILQDITIQAESGKVTAIVGPSGGGKTTLFSLLERFYSPSLGRIRYGETDIADIALSTWRKQIGYVSQESPLLAGTIRDNLCYGLDREVSDEEMEQAAAMAYADGFIAELPEGYATQVGERGIKLSGGQRQRIAIARALLRNPRILLLDEATSSLDSHSETVVQLALTNLMKGRTTLVIAHRLSTVIDADSIIFIEKGRVTGTGTHEELYVSHALYREFADSQLRMEPQTATLEQTDEDRQFEEVFKLVMADARELMLLEMELIEPTGEGKA